MASMTSMLAAVLCVAVCCMHAVQACGETLLSSGFDSHNGGFQSWKRSMAESDFPVGLKYTKGIERASVGEGALKILQPQGGVGPGGTGMLMRVDLPREVDSATLSYRVKFDANYDWTAGGKLPGLCDGDCPTGCTNMNSSPGWSSRLMFREGGRAESYMYYPNMKDFGTCGLSWMTSASFSAGNWHDVKLYVKLNTGGQSNGEQKVWIDGNEVLSKNDIKFRPGDGNRIAQLKFECFHGGKSDQFKPSKSQFDDFKVVEGFCPSGGGTTSTLFDETDKTEEPLQAEEPAEEPSEEPLQGEDPLLGRKGGPGRAPTDSDTQTDTKFDFDTGTLMNDEGSDGEQSDVAGASTLKDPENNDEEIDDDDGDNDHDCGDKGEDVCTPAQIQEHDREFECDYMYHNSGQGTCVEWA